MTGNISNTPSINNPLGKGGDSPLVIQIGSKNFAHPDYVANLLRVTRRTLNRWTQDRKGPPKIIIGQRSLYDLDKLVVWLEANEINPLPSQRGIN